MGGFRTLLLVAVAGTLLTGPVAATIGDQPLPDQTTTPPATPSTPANATTIANNVTVERVANHTYQLGVGTEGPRMLLRFNLSLFGNFPDEGVLRFTGLGLIDGEFVIEIDLSLLFDGIDTLGQFIANPFDHFTVDGRTVLDLPFPTADDAAGSPVESAG